ncbi:MAG: Uma2 family endonuclease [Verrucomicrobiaceae bacterium]|nr:Uma2 family endonuclease [Verrucomicrobiaceae bacterium]
MSAALKLQEPELVSWEVYETKEKLSDVRHEFVNGQVFAMAGGSWNHNRIAGDIFNSLSNQLRGKPCEAFMSDLKLRIDLNHEQFGYYPDVMVVCDKQDQHQTHVTNPVVVFEVLSQSTARIDRREKLLAYQGVPGLAVYVLVEQSFPMITVHRRSNQWQAEIIKGLDGVLTLPEIGSTLTLAAIYERVDWENVERETV